MDDARRLTDALAGEFERRVVQESLTRILKCLDLLDVEQVWSRPNENTVSVGNLVLHLAGNLRQYVVAGLGAALDTRRRAEEFSEHGPLPTAELVERIGGTVRAAAVVVRRLEPAALLATHRVQGFEETGTSILVHVIEHFSYHTGQITYAAKTMLNVDTGYYAGQDLDQTSG
ncbi:MAG: DUF664 domain-containing protein [Planctomycetota bacterium]|nr:DUF664 domain-containing protein [Planctomycetota bacterium]